MQNLEESSFMNSDDGLGSCVLPMIENPRTCCKFPSDDKVRISMVSLATMTLISACGSDNELTEENNNNSVVIPVEDRYRCNLIESLEDDSGRISVDAYSLPDDVGVSYMRMSANKIVMVGNKYIYIIDTTKPICDAVTQLPLPVDLTYLGRSLEIIKHENKFYIAYERGIVSLTQDLKEVQELLLFEDIGEDPVINITSMIVVGRQLVGGGWRDFSLLDQEVHAQILDIFEDDFKATTTTPAFQKFRDLMSVPMIFIDIDTHEVKVSPGNYPVFEYRSVNNGQSVYAGIDFGTDLLCDNRDNITPQEFMESCVEGGAEATMSVNNLSPGLCADLGLGSECYIVPQTHDTMGVSVPFDEVVYITTDAVGGPNPVFWDMEALSTNENEFLVMSGRLGGYWDIMFGGGVPLRQTCFSLYTLDFLNGDPHMRLGENECTPTEQLTVSNDLLAVDCPGGSNAADCFVAINLETSPNDGVLYHVEIRKK